MKLENLNILLFAAFAIGLPWWAMHSNAFHQPAVHSCTGPCYEAWKAETGGVLALAEAKAAARAEASPEELGEQAYAGCIACHGAAGEGGVGPQLAGQDAATVADKLARYKNGETVGPQSNLMWSQAAALSGQDIDHLAAFIETL